MKSIKEETTYLKFEVIQRDKEFGGNNYIRITSKSCYPPETVTLEEIDLEQINHILKRLKSL